MVLVSTDRLARQLILFISLSLFIGAIAAKPLTVLVEGWTLIPHSYAIVSVFQLHALSRRYNSTLRLLTREHLPYYKPQWAQLAQDLIYNDEVNSFVMDQLQAWDGVEKVDLVYRLTYPYFIHRHQPANFVMDTSVGGGQIKDSSSTVVPVLTYFTAEYMPIDFGYFGELSQRLLPEFNAYRRSHVDDSSTSLPSRADSDAFIKFYLDKVNRDVYFHSPSMWSRDALLPFGIAGHEGSKEPQQGRHWVISGGVDLSIFRKLSLTERDWSSRKAAIRAQYGLAMDDYVILNVGAMTRNKGPLEMLVVLNYIVHHLERTEVKLLLKGPGSLHDSDRWMTMYYQELTASGYMTSAELDNIRENHILFIEDLVTYPDMNDLMNICDVYLSPYTAEGFNMPVLEAIAAGARVVVSDKGSTDFFVKDINKNVPHMRNRIHLIPSRITTMDDGKRRLLLKPDDILATVLNALDARDEEETHEEHEKLLELMDSNYSWDAISQQLYAYFQFIVTDTAKRSRDMITTAGAGININSIHN